MKRRLFAVFLPLIGVALLGCMPGDCFCSRSHHATTADQALSAHR